MVRGQTLRVHLTGGAPWGFRLQGGSEANLPITISKIRRRSKANLAKLEEGDEIVTINGKTCEGITRDVAMTYIDNAQESLDVEFIRREANNNISDSLHSTTVGHSPVTVSQSQGGDDPSTLEFKFQLPKFSPMSIPVGPPPKTGVWSPGSQQTQPEHRQSSNVTYNETVKTSHSQPQETTQTRTTHTTTTVIQPIGVWQPGKSSTPKREEVEITFSPVPMPITPITMVSPPPPPPPSQPEAEKSNPSILDDPSLILAGMAPGQREQSTIETKKQSKSKIQMQRPFSYHGYSNIDDEVDAFASVDDQKRICKKIADLLMFPTNKQAKGARMFLKRRKKSAKWTREGYGTRVIEDYDTMPDVFRPTVPMTSFIPPPPPPPPPVPVFGADVPADDPSRLLFQYTPSAAGRKTSPVTPKAPRTITIEPTNFNINLKDPSKCMHVAVTPTMCGMLAQDLKSSGGRASVMFAKRQKRVEKFVTDESNVKSPPAVIEVDHSPSGGMKITLKGISNSDEKPSDKRPIVAKHKTPWEAAMESPYGAVDGAFDHIDSGPIKVQVNMPKHLVQNAQHLATIPASKQLPKPPDAWKTTSVSPSTVQETLKFSPVPQIRPKFKATPPSLADNESENTFKPSPFETNYNRKSKGWSPVGDSYQSGSPAMSDKSGSSDSKSLQMTPSSSFTDYNLKPKAWGSSVNESSHGFQPVSPHAVSPAPMIESEDL